MYAIVQIGNEQFKVAEGDTIQADRMESDTAKDIALDQVLMFAKGSDIRIGQPFLKDVKVTAKVVDHVLGKKTVAFKYRRRKDSAFKKGNRAKLTTLSIVKIAA